MAVDVNTFRTEHKTALYNGLSIHVYAYRYLCRLSDLDDHWGERKRRAALMQSSVEHAENLFAEKKPAFVAHVYEKEWEGAQVYAEPKGALWYDCDAFPGRLVGFLTKRKTGWLVLSAYTYNERRQIAGVWVDRCYTRQVIDGKITEKSLGWNMDNVGYTPEEFQAWREPAEKAYLEQIREQERKRKEEDDAIRAARQAQLAAKDAEIVEATSRLEQLKQERARI